MDEEPWDYDKLQELEEALPPESGRFSKQSQK